MTLRTPVTAALLGAAVVAFPAFAAPGQTAREQSCVSTATFMGVPHIGVGGLPAQDTGHAAGLGVIPGCNDVVSFPPAPPSPDQVVAFFRVRGVAPRFAVTDEAGSVLFIPETSPCLQSAAGRRIVPCLQDRTRRYVRGPSLIAPPSAPAGAMITVGVHVRDPRLRRRVAYGLDAVLLRPEGDGWRAVYRLAWPVSSGAPTAAPFGEPFSVPAIGLVGGASRPLRLPAVEPGPYRLAKRIFVGPAQRWLLADLTVLPAPVP